MTSFIYTFFLYILSILFFFSSTQPYLFWLFMEINLICFIFFIYMMNPEFYSSEFTGMTFFYFLVQSVASMMFLFSISLKSAMLYLYLDWIFILSLVLKLGIFPLFFWIFKLGSSLGFSILFLIITFQKVPMLLVFFLMDFNFILSLLVFSFVVGSFLIFFSNLLSDILISSSIASSYWLFLFYLEDLTLFFSFFLFYTLILFIFFFKSTEFKHNSMNILIFSFFCGLPPLSLFFFKFFLSKFLFLEFDYLFFIIFWIFSFYSLVGYTKFFFFNFFLSKFLYLKQNFCFKKMSFLGICFFFFLPYIC